MELSQVPYFSQGNKLMSEKSNFKEMIRQEIRKMVDEDQLLPKPELGEPHYLDLEDDFEDIESQKNYDVLIGYTDSNIDNYVDHINEQCSVCATVPIQHVGLPKKGHKSGAYMSKSQLYKISKYAEKLYHMIPDNYDLEDWMRSKLSEISDDIGEVYHALDHRKFKGKF